MFPVLLAQGTTNPTTHQSAVTTMLEDRLSIHDILGPAFWSELIQECFRWLLAFIPQLVIALVLFFVFYSLYRIARRITNSTMKRAHVDSTLHELVVSFLRWTILGFGLVIALNQVGIQITALLTGVSIIGLAIGFAAQTTLSNFIAGMVILWDRPFKVGDWITLDGQYGRVLRISFRTTRVLGSTGETIVFPNTVITANRLSNHSAQPMASVNMSIPVPAAMSIDKARQAVLALLEKDLRIRSDPPATLVVQSVAIDSMTLGFRFWIDDKAREGPLCHEYLEKAKKALDELK